MCAPLGICARSINPQKLRVVFADCRKCSGAMSHGLRVGVMCIGQMAPFGNVQLQSVISTPGAARTQITLCSRSRRGWPPQGMGGNRMRAPILKQRLSTCARHPQQMSPLDAALRVNHVRSMGLKAVGFIDVSRLTLAMCRLHPVALADGSAISSTGELFRPASFATPPYPDSGALPVQTPPGGHKLGASDTQRKRSLRSAARPPSSSPHTAPPPPGG